MWPAVSKMSSLKRTTEVVEHRSGGDPSTSHKSPGRQKYDAITLERGLTQDMNFHDWAGLVWNFGAGSGLRKCRWRTSARTSTSSSTTKPGSW